MSWNDQKCLPCWIGLLLLLMSALAWSDNAEMAERIKPCTVCHGEQGRAGPDGYYPRLAGKPQGYLWHQMQNFVQGRRHYPLMHHLLEPLSDAYLQEMAIYFSQLTLPYPAPTKGVTDYAKDQLERGRALALTGDATLQVPACVSCHGADLMGQRPDVPSLLGLPLAYVSAQLSAWREGQRVTPAPDCMAHIAKRLSVRDAAAVSAWLSVQTVSHTPWVTSVTPLDANWRCGSAPQIGEGRGR